ncbi:hypothetical protein [Gemmobacter sp. 24YEA27]|uniref:hypothetical protein n=1 Tax=Gemmobacter sp. 24YEA27 TaxID=3040672 RepID=UPI0024B31F79|nr:hypothetical protein [Gemmobacter sp. 24YEA27]
MTEAFFAAIRPLFGGSLKQAQVDGLNAILAATTTLPRSFRAYILATAYHETAHTMQPIREYGRGKGKKYGVVDQTGKAPYGRGYVQLTWRENYQRADRELGLGGRLAADYDLALDPAISAQILVEGMLDGWFTGKALRDYLPGDYIGARRIVNGTDRAQQIAGYARDFEAALVAGDDPAGAAADPFAAPGWLAAFLKFIATLLRRSK